MIIRRVGKFALILLLASALGACGIFGDKDEEELPPKELLKFQQTLPVKKAWSAKVGGGSEFLRLGLMPAGDSSKIFAASHDGRVTAFSPDNGKVLWRVDTDASLSAGPSFGGNLVVVASADGELIGLSASDGTELWRTDTGAEVLARPLIHENAVIVRTVDGKLAVYESFDGSERWVVEQEVPSLSIRGTSAPVIVGSTVVAGFDNGRLMAVSVATGDTMWEALLSPASGRSDLDRLSDVDGYMIVSGQDVFAAGFQGQVAAVAVESGQALWSREHSTFNGLGLDWNSVYLLVDEGDLIALARRNGVETWRQDALQRRWPVAPTAFNTAVAVGDFEGYMHFFDSADGTPVARIRVAKGPLSGYPLIVGETLYVQSEAGTLTALRVQQSKKPRRSAPDTASGEN